MMLSGLSTSVALSVIDRNQARQLDLVASEAQTAREIDVFRDRVGQIGSVEDFVADTELFAFVMRAFDLEDQIFGKAMMRQVLSSDITDEESLAARMTDPRFRELYAEMGFESGGTVSPNTGDPDWQERMVDRFVERRFINAQEETNADLGTALEFRLRAPEINSWYDVLKDEDVARVLQTALGLPASISNLDLDRQIEIYESKMDLADFQDLQKVASLERRFAAIADAEAAVAGTTSAPILQLFAQNSAFTPVTLDIEAIVTSFRRF